MLGRGSLLWDGSDISPSANLDTPVGNLSSEDVKQLEKAADKAGVTLSVAEGKLTLDDLARLAKQLRKAVAKDLSIMGTAKCREGMMKALKTGRFLFRMNWLWASLLLALTPTWTGCTGSQDSRRVHEADDAARIDSSSAGDVGGSSRYDGEKVCGEPGDRLYGGRDIDQLDDDCDVFSGTLDFANYTGGISVYYLRFESSKARSISL